MKWRVRNNEQTTGHASETDELDITLRSHVLPPSWAEPHVRSGRSGPPATRAQLQQPDGNERAAAAAERAADGEMVRSRREDVWSSTNSQGWVFSTFFFTHQAEQLYPTSL